MKRELSLDELRVVMRKYLEAHDLKETYTRNIVLEYVYQLEKPFDADSVYKKLRPLVPLRHSHSFNAQFRS